MKSGARLLCSEGLEGLVDSDEPTRGVGASTSSTMASCGSSSCSSSSAPSLLSRDPLLACLQPRQDLRCSATYTQSTAAAWGAKHRLALQGRR